MGGVRKPCPAGRYGNSTGLDSPACTAACPKGHYCPSGTARGDQFRCPAGRYGDVEGLMSSACSGECSAGYHCLEGSASPTELPCAELSRSKVDLTTWSTLMDGTLFPANEYLANSTGYLSEFTTKATKSTDGSGLVSYFITTPNGVFCPSGSGLPLRVLSGYYSIGSSAMTRSDQMPCPVGSFCTDGIMAECPAGVFGAQERMTASNCSGLCAKGYYCPPGSTSATQLPCPIGKQ